MLGLIGGIMITDTRADLVLRDHVIQDTYFVVVHFYYVLHLPVVFGCFAGWYYLFPRITGYAYSDTLGRIHFWLLFIGVNTALASHVLLVSGLLGRVVHTPDVIRFANQVSWIAGFIAATGILVFFVNMVLSFLRRRPAN